MAYRNGEGYVDPTAGAAMSLVMKEYRQKQRQRFFDRHRKKIYVNTGRNRGSGFLTAIGRRSMWHRSMPEIYGAIRRKH